jgi:hypothetical protein
MDQFTGEKNREKLLVAANVLQLQEVGDFYHKCSYEERMFD